MDGTDRLGGAGAMTREAADWACRAPVAARRELHFTDRLFACAAARPANLLDMLEQGRDLDPAALALIDGPLRLSHAELHRRGGEIAAGLRGMGIAHGDRVAALLGNRGDFIALMLACFRIGAVLLPMNPRYAAPEIAYAVNDSGARLLAHEASLTATLPPPGLTPHLLRRIPVSDDMPLFPGAGPAPDPDPGREEDVAVILYTSGTTGRPKGAMLSHLNLIHSAIQLRAAQGLSPADRTVLSVPATHVTGLAANILPLLAAGGAVGILRDFHAASFLAFMEAERITHAMMVPAMYKLCLMDPSFDARDLSAWRLGSFGGAPMPAPTIEELARRLPSLRLQQGYGATETSSAVTLMPPEATPTRTTSVGTALQFSELAVMDEAGRELAPGEIGEIWIRGALVIPGYWRRPDANEAEFSAGWWKSGDLGRIDAQGFVEVLDRRKDMINRGGYKVFSTEVENVLTAHPGVAECAVLGYPCEVLGERVRAVIRLAPGHEEAAVQADLVALAAARLADFRRPEQWRFTADPLPRNANGKILKRALRDLG